MSLKDLSITQQTNSWKKNIHANQTPNSEICSMPQIQIATENPSMMDHQNGKS